MEQEQNTVTEPVSPVPHPRLRQLDVLVGTWRVETRDLVSSERTTGTMTRRWMPGGLFLEQRTTTDGHGGSDGVEYIGWDSEVESIRSMYFSPEGPGPFCPFALEYFWDLDADRLTIWHGWKDSPARFTGTIDGAAGVVRGRWEWPGGGYEAVSTRVAC